MKKENSEFVYCNRCDADIIPINEKCPNCGLIFSQDLIDYETEENYIDDCPKIIDRKKDTQKYKIIAILILILGFVGGIIVGNYYGVCDDYSLINNICQETEFNSDLMFGVWVSSSLLSIFVFAIHSICYRLDLIIDKKDI